MLKPTTHLYYQSSHAHLRAPSIRTQAVPTPTRAARTSDGVASAHREHELHKLLPGRVLDAPGDASPRARARHRHVTLPPGPVLIEQRSRPKQHARAWHGGAPTESANHEAARGKVERACNFSIGQSRSRQGPAGLTWLPTAHLALPRKVRRPRQVSRRRTLRVGRLGGWGTKVCDQGSRGATRLCPICFVIWVVVFRAQRFTWFNCRPTPVIRTL